MLNRVMIVGYRLLKSSAATPSWYPTTGGNTYAPVYSTLSPFFPSVSISPSAPRCLTLDPICSFMYAGSASI